MIGTCSNLLYVQHESGEIAAIDVAARLMLAGTDPPATGPSGQHESTYTFGCHPETGLHKVVHVPSHESAELDAVHVLTLEDDGFPPEWRHYRNWLIRHVHQAHGKGLVGTRRSFRRQWQR